MAPSRASLLYLAGSFDCEDVLQRRASDRVTHKHEFCKWPPACLSALPMAMTRAESVIAAAAFLLSPPAHGLMLFLSLSEFVACSGGRPSFLGLVPSL